MKKFLLNIPFVLMMFFPYEQLFSKTENIKSQLESLSGVYADSIPYRYGHAWGIRTFTFDKGKWSLVFVLSFDSAFTQKAFQFRTYGNYLVQEKHPTLENTFSAVFFEEKKYLTVLATDTEVQKVFGFNSCNLIVGKEEDISLNGCNAWKSVKDCPADYDLLAIDNFGKVYFGIRPKNNDMCSPELRPTTLTPPVTKR